MNTTDDSELRERLWWLHTLMLANLRALDHISSATRDPELYVSLNGLSAAELVAASENIAVATNIAIELIALQQAAVAK